MLDREEIAKRFAEAFADPAEIQADLDQLGKDWAEVDEESARALLVEMDRKSVLFVCTGNRARSQMAEGLLRHLGGERFEVHSAGIVPNGMSELTIGAMKEIGIDVSEQWSKSVEVYRGQEFDFVITVCNSANETCPVFPGDGQRLHWDIEDPSDIEARGLPLKEAFRIARDDLQARIAKFVGFVE